MRILVALEKKETREILSFSLESRFGCWVLPAKSTAEALDLIQKGDRIDMVVCQHPLPGESIMKMMATRDFPIPTLVCSGINITEEEASRYERSGVIGHVTGTNWATDLIPLVEDWMKANHLQEEGAEGAFVPICPDLLLMASPLDGDVYIRLSAAKYLKLFKAGDPFNSLDYDRYVNQRGVPFFHIKKEESRRFLGKLHAKLAADLAAEKMSPAAATEVAKRLHQTVRELVNQFGPSEEIQGLVRLNMQLTAKAIGKNPRLKNVISKLTKDPKTYIASHSIALSHVCCAIAHAMEWGSDTTFHKLNMAAFLHDITLSNHTLAEVQTLEELNRRKGEFPKEDLSAYPLHCQRAAELARQFKEVPIDVDTILLQHHERPDGSGFPRRLAYKAISPLSSLFIIAHDLVRSMHEKGDEFSLQGYVEMNRDRFNYGQFRKVIVCLDRIKA